MKKIILIALMMLVVNFAEAKVYVCLDKGDGSPQGMVDIDETVVGDWAQRFIMIEADESYRGFQGHEIKYSGQKLRKATQKEVEDYEVENLKKSKEAKEKDILESLGITKSDLEKIKALP